MQFVPAEKVAKIATRGSKLRAKKKRMDVQEEEGG
jgi:hypothetical protein